VERQQISFGLGASIPLEVVDQAPGADGRTHDRSRGAASASATPTTFAAAHAAPSARASSRSSASSPISAVHAHGQSGRRGRGNAQDERDRGGNNASDGPIQTLHDCSPMLPIGEYHQTRDPAGLFEPRPGSTRTFSGPMESDRSSSCLFLPHFLRRTGVHFVGKCFHSQERETHARG
jgi:hypothetical protein